MNNLQKLSRTTKQLLFDEPFYGHFLVGLNRLWSKDIPTAGVAKDGIGVKLVVNEDFFDNLNENHRKGLLKHELLHIAFGHLEIRSNFADKKLFNIAADLEINQYINPSWLPEGGITMDTFPELTLPAKAGTRKYYELLQQEKDGGNSPTLEHLLNEMDGNSPYDHSTWDEIDNLSEAEKKLIQRQIEHQLKETADAVEKSRGSIPGELSNIISKLRTVEPPKFDWKGYLRRFVGNSNRSYTKILRRKPNKRYPDNPGLKIKYRAHTLVAIDTSGSVSDGELREFLNEIHHIHKTGNEISIVQCDTKMYDPEPFNPKKDFTVRGRGGTDFQPVIDHFNKYPGKYTSLIYLTDGEAPAPERCPKKVLWCLSSRSQETNHLPGYTIKLN